MRRRHHHGWNQRMRRLIGWNGSRKNSDKNLLTIEVEAPRRTSTTTTTTVDEEQGNDEEEEEEQEQDNHHDLLPVWFAGDTVKGILRYHVQNIQARVAPVKRTTTYSIHLIAEGNERAHIHSPMTSGVKSCRAERPMLRSDTILVHHLERSFIRPPSRTGHDDDDDDGNEEEEVNDDDEGDVAEDNGWRLVPFELELPTSLPSSMRVHAAEDDRHNTLVGPAFHHSSPKSYASILYHIRVELRKTKYQAIQHHHHTTNDNNNEDGAHDNSSSSFLTSHPTKVKCMTRTGSIPLTIQSAPLPPEIVPWRMAPTTVEMKSLGLTKLGSLSMACQVADTHVSKDDVLQVNFACRNNATGMEIEYVHCTLYETVTWNAKGRECIVTKALTDEKFVLDNDAGRMMTQTEDISNAMWVNHHHHRFTLMEGWMDQLHAENERELFVDLIRKRCVLDIAVPSTAQDSYPCGKVLTVQHSLKVMIKTSSMVNDPYVEIPLLIQNYLPMEQRRRRIVGQRTRNHPGPLLLSSNESAMPITLRGDQGESVPDAEGECDGDGDGEGENEEVEEAAGEDEDEEAQGEEDQDETMEEDGGDEDEEEPPPDPDVDGEAEVTEEAEAEDDEDDDDDSADSASALPIARRIMDASVRELAMESIRVLGEALLEEEEEEEEGEEGDDDDDDDDEDGGNDEEENVEEDENDENEEQEEDEEDVVSQATIELARPILIPSSSVRLGGAEVTERSVTDSEVSRTSASFQRWSSMWGDSSESVAAFLMASSSDAFLDAGGDGEMTSVGEESSEFFVPPEDDEAAAMYGAEDHDEQDHEQQQQQLLLPSLENLLEEMLHSMDDFVIVQTKIVDPEWRCILTGVNAEEYGNILSHVHLDFDQPKVAACIASYMLVDHERFPCDYVQSAVLVSAEWNRCTMLSRLLPFCTDLVENRDVLLDMLTPWELTIIAPDFEAALNALPA